MNMLGSGQKEIIASSHMRKTYGEVRFKILLITMYFLFMIYKYIMIVDLIYLSYLKFMKMVTLKYMKRVKPI